MHGGGAAVLLDDSDDAAFEDGHDAIYKLRVIVLSAVRLEAPAREEPGLARGRTATCGGRLRHVTRGRASGGSPSLKERKSRNSFPVTPFPMISESS